MSFSYNLVLVALSVAVAAQASFMALSLAQRIPAAFALNRRLLTAGSALSLAVGVWSMHFIGMLAVRTPFRLDYALLPTLISLLICVLAAGIAVVLASLRPRRMMLLAAAVLGLGIVAMHFIGMMAMRECASVSYDPAFVLASVVIACTASGSALWLAFSAQRKLPLLLCAIILGLAISGMHYTAMGGTRLQPNPVAFAANGAAISSDLLAAIVSVVAFSISGVFMLTLIPASDDIAAEAQHFAPERNELPGPRCAVVAYNRASNLVGPEILLPIERNGGKLHIAADEIVSVHANAFFQEFACLPLSSGGASSPHAAKSRPFRKLSIGGANARIAIAQMGQCRHAHQACSILILRCADFDFLLQGVNLFSQLFDLLHKRSQFPHRIWKRRFGIFDRFNETGDVNDSLWSNHPRPRDAAQGVDDLGALANEEVAHAVGHALRLLFFCFHSHVAHGGWRRLITPIFSTAPTTCSARCRSRKSRISCQSRRFFAPIAATLSI